MSDFGTMVARIGSELVRADLDTQIKRAIVSAIEHWGRRRFPWNERTTSWVTTSGTQAYAEGSGLVPVTKKTDLLQITYGGSDQSLTERGYDYIRAVTTSSALTGPPSEWAYYEDKYWLYPIPDASYSITHSFVRPLTDVSLSASDAATNAWMTTAEELIRQRAKSLVKIDVLDRAEAKAEAMNLAGTACLSIMEKAALDELNAVTAQKASSGGRLVPTSF